MPTTDYPIKNGAPGTAMPTVPHSIDGSGLAVPASASAPIPVTQVASAGSLTWTKTNPTLSGGSDTLLPANAARKALIISNPAANSAAAVDITGGTASLTNAYPLAAGATITLTAPDCPTGAITAIGTNPNKLVVFEGV